MSLVFAGVCSHAPGITGRAHLAEPGVRDAFHAEFRAKAHDNLAVDHAGALVYLAPSRVNLQLTLERWPELTFRETRESQSA